MLLVATCVYTSSPESRLAPWLALLGAESHFIVTRVHGDCRGGKCAPTLFVLLLHSAATLSGTPPVVALSLHRLLIVWTYFATGARKMYCVGPIWCDGKNLQLILAIQGLYHDGERGWNFVLARYPSLCCVASVAVVALQLALPICLYAAHPAALALGFSLALAFHASNMILWRINFFVAWVPALLALLAPGEQLPAAVLLECATSTAAAAPAAVLLLYSLLQTGHALDLATERLLEGHLGPCWIILESSWMPTWAMELPWEPSWAIMEPS